MLYRVAVRWSNQKISLAAGKAYELTHEEVDEVRKDCGPDAVVPLPYPELSTLAEALDAAGIVSASFRPPAVSNAGRGSRPGAGVMTTADAFGGL